MWRDDVLCKDNPVTFMYAIYPCYSNFYYYKLYYFS